MVRVSGRQSGRGWERGGRGLGGRQVERVVRDGAVVVVEVGVTDSWGTCTQLGEAENGTPTSLKLYRLNALGRTVG